MSRTRTVYDSKGEAAEYLDDELVWVRDDYSPNVKVGINVIHDIEPYQSMVDGSMIRSRSHHRDHLRAHGCIEVGNEKMETRLSTPTGSRREVLHHQLADMSDRQANKFLKNLRRQ